MIKLNLDGLVSIVWMEESWIQSKLESILFVMVFLQVIQHVDSTMEDWLKKTN